MEGIRLYKKYREVDRYILKDTSGIGSDHSLTIATFVSSSIGFYVSIFRFLDSHWLVCLTTIDPKLANKVASLAYFLVQSSSVAWWLAGGTRTIPIKTHWNVCGE